MSISVSVFAVVLAACSGAGNEDLFEETEQQDVSKTDPAPTTTDPVKTTPGKTGETTTPGTPAPPATPTTPPAADACTQEIEPNNDLVRATPFKERLCGKIDSATDVDYGRIIVPAKATTLTFKHSEKNGRLNYRFFLNSVPIQANEEINVLPGATYSVQIRPPTGGGGGDRPQYELEVAFQ